MSKGEVNEAPNHTAIVRGGVGMKVSAFKAYVMFVTQGTLSKATDYRSWLKIVVIVRTGRDSNLHLCIINHTHTLDAGLDGALRRL